MSTPPTQNLAVAFRAEDFPRDGVPSADRAREAAELVVADEQTRTPLAYSLNSLRDGTLLVVYEPYPLVGDLRAVPSNDPVNRDITFSGKTERRTEWRSDHYRLNVGSALLHTTPKE